MSLPTMPDSVQTRSQENRLEGFVAFGFRTVYRSPLSAVSVGSLHSPIDNVLTDCIDRLLLTTD